MPSEAEGLTITLDDLQQHSDRYGLDVYPSLDVRNEVARAHDLFQTLQVNWPALYQELSFAPQANEFKILASFTFDAGSVKIPILTFTQRGPVFRFPLRVPPPFGDCEYDKKDDLDGLFRESLNCVRKTFPDLQVLRIGLVRELIFGTGRVSSIPYLASRYGTFPGTEPLGGNATITFRDERCNIRVIVGTVEVRRQAQVAVTGQVLSEELEYGLKVEFDVNNIELRPQSDPEIDMTLARAHSLWPKALLDFINWRKNAS